MENVHQTDWHAEDIKAAIRKKGSSLAELAKQSELNRQLLSSCLRNRVSERAERIIAEFLGVKPHQIWPSRYVKNGKRVRLCSPRNGERKAA